MNTTARNYVERKLRQPIDDALWDELVDEGSVDDAENFGDYDSLVLRAKRYLRVAKQCGRRVTRPRRTGAPVPFALLTLEQQRAAAVTEYLAAQAELEPSLRRFREAYLDGSPVPPHEAPQLLASPALQLVDLAVLKRYAIPVRAHRAVLIAGPSAPQQVTVEWASCTRKFEVASPARNVEFGNPDNPLRLAVVAGSFFDLLWQLAESLAPRYWPTPWMSSFILTGQAPFWHPISVRTELLDSPVLTAGWITIRVEPWLADASVLAAYRAGQHHFFRTENRPPSARSLALFRFVTAGWLNESGTPRDWRAIWRAWNETHPDQRYPEMRNLHLAYQRVFHALIQPEITNHYLEATEHGQES